MEAITLPSDGTVFASVLPLFRLFFGFHVKCRTNGSPIVTNLCVKSAGTVF
jgi:hypothetical protein